MRWLSNLQGTLGLRYGFDDDYASSAFFGGGEVGGQARFMIHAGKIQSCGSARDSDQ